MPKLQQLEESPARWGHDTDLLTEEELEESGFIEIARRRHNNKSSLHPKCDACGKPVAEPVTSYVRFGYEFIEEGELLHVKCAKKRFTALCNLLNPNS